MDRNAHVESNKHFFSIGSFTTAFCGVHWQSLLSATIFSQRWVAGQQSIVKRPSMCLICCWNKMLVLDPTLHPPVGHGWAGDRDWHFGFETSRFRDFCQCFEGFGFGFREFGIGKKVSVSVSKDLVSKKKSQFRFCKIWSRKKVSVSVSENLVSEKKSRYRFRKIWYRKKVSVSVSVKILVSSFSGPKVD